MCANAYGSIYGDMRATRYRMQEPIDDKMKITQVNEITGFTILTLTTEFSLVFKEDYLTAFEGFSRRYRSQSAPTFEAKLSFSRYRDLAAAYVSPVAWVSSVFTRVLREARRYAQSLGCSLDVTRDCECVVGVVFKARNNYDKDSIAKYVADFYGISTENLRSMTGDRGKIYRGSDLVLLAVSAFLSSRDTDSAVELALTAGNGNGAIATITGSIAEAFYGTLLQYQWSECQHCLDEFLDNTHEYFFMEFIMGGVRNETKLGGEILLPECPDAWKEWLVSICVDFTFIDGFLIFADMFKEYFRPTLHQSAVFLFQREDEDCIFPSYGVFTVDVVPAFEWWVSWPLQRRGTMDGILRRGEAGGAEGWEARYKSTLLRLYMMPKYSDTSWCYIPSKGQLRLDVGGRTKAQAIDNWYRVARLLRRILKQVRADLQRTDMG